jgi:hypothetical protein
MPKNRCRLSAASGTRHRTQHDSAVVKIKKTAALLHVEWQQGCPR